MQRRFGPSLYFANDKVVFDALNHTQVSTATLRELLEERGTIVSPKTPKYELAQYFSRLTADYFDHQNISTKLGKVARRERITYAEIDEDLSQQEVIDALQACKPALEDQGNLVDIEVKEGRILTTLQYEHIDYTEVEFRQVQPRDGVIEFLKQASGKYVVRSTQNKEIDASVDVVFATINASREVKVRPQRISLQGFTDPRLRCRFFESLVQGIENHAFITVTEAFCYKPRASAVDEDADDDRADPKELEDQPNVVRVTLKGTGVTKSFVIEELYAKGYYIVKTVWRIKPTSSMDADVFELEAQFGDPDDCTDFSYQARTAILFENGALTDKKRTPKIEEQDSLFRLIEAAAKKAYAGLK